MLSVERGARTKVRINASSLSIIQSCPRKAFYLLHEGWRPRSGSPALIFGTAIHKALEVFYGHGSRERDIPTNFEEHATLIGRGYDAPEAHFLYDAVTAFVEKAEPLRMLPDDDKHSIPSGIWVLSHYFKTYINDHYVIHTDEKGPVVERTFEWPLWSDDTLEIVLFGTIDFALRNEATGEILVGDHKTASQLSSEFMARVKPNHQYTGYLIGAHNVLGVSGENFLVNGIEKKARPKTSRGGPPRFIRQITRRDSNDFAEFHFVIREAVESYLRWLERGTWPLGPVDSCAMWGGCTFLDVCSAPVMLRENILEAKFTR